jgi:hypothetical protein
MWITIIVGYALASFISPQHANRIDLQWIYVSDGLKWETPPKGTTEGVKYCNNAFLAVFFPSGDYAAVFPVLYRDNKTKHISISRGDGMVIRNGRWTKETNGSIRIVSSIVYTPLPQAGRHYPTDKKEEEWKPSGKAEGRIASKLRSPKVTLVPLQNFTDLEFLSNYIATEGSAAAQLHDLVQGNSR